MCVCVCVFVYINRKITESSVRKEKTILKNKIARALSSGTYQARSLESAKTGICIYIIGLE